MVGGTVCVLPCVCVCGSCCPPHSFAVCVWKRAERKRTELFSPRVEAEVCRALTPQVYLDAHTLERMNSNGVVNNGANGFNGNGGA